MSDERIKELKTEIIEIGKLLWNKNLALGLNGNISLKVDEDKILLTGTKTCLGLLEKKDVILCDLDGNVLEGGEISTETLMHTEIYKNISHAKAIIHTHPSYTNAYYLHNDTLSPNNFETKIYLGQVNSIDQTTPSVTDAAPVIKNLKTNNITVLKKHGPVAIGETLFDCFLLIQGLEEACKIDAISRLYQRDGQSETEPQPNFGPGAKIYKLFSQEQVNEIVKLVNEDEQMRNLGGHTKMTMELAVKLEETGKVYSFNFENGHIKSVGNNEDAEFLTSAPESVWRAIFKSEIDPFVATTQKKMILRGDFAKLSKWYAPCNRVFELWTNVPVE